MVGTGTDDLGGPIRVGSTVAGAQVVGKTWLDGYWIVHEGNTEGHLYPDGTPVPNSFRPIDSSNTRGSGGAGGAGGGAGGGGGSAGGVGGTGGSAQTPSGGTGGTGGSGSGNGSGDGTGDGSGSGEGGTPLADGLMSMLGGGDTDTIPLWKAPKARRIAAAQNYEVPGTPKALMPNNIWGRKV